MTGFARRERQGPWGTLVCELRTVNHRYLEASLRLPDELKALDNEARQAIAAALRRGKVDASLYLKAASGSQRSLELDAKPVLLAALELLREALAELNETRHREGQRIRELLLARCASMRASVLVVKVRLPEVSQRLRDRIVERLSQLGAAPDAERLEQELVLYAHKMDVDEELDRLSGHLDEVSAVLDSSEPAGRRLDFLMQELNREANTLSSKSQDSETTRAAVDMKVAIEQMREQVQNVE